MNACMSFTNDLIKSFHSVFSIDGNTLHLKEGTSKEDIITVLNTCSQGYDRVILELNEESNVLQYEKECLTKLFGQSPKPKPRKSIADMHKGVPFAYLSRWLPPRVSKGNFQFKVNK